MPGANMGDQEILCGVTSLAGMPESVQEGGFMLLLIGLHQRW